MFEAYKVGANSVALSIPQISYYQIGIGQAEPFAPEPKKKRLAVRELGWVREEVKMKNSFTNERGIEANIRGFIIPKTTVGDVLQVWAYMTKAIDTGTDGKPMSESKRRRMRRQIPREARPYKEWDDTTAQLFRYIREHGLNPVALAVVYPHNIEFWKKVRKTSIYLDSKGVPMSAWTLIKESVAEAVDDLLEYPRKWGIWAWLKWVLLAMAVVLGGLVILNVVQAIRGE